MSKFVSKPTVNSIMYRVLSGVEEGCHGEDWYKEKDSQGDLHIVLLVYINIYIYTYKLCNGNSLVLVEKRLQDGQIFSRLQHPKLHIAAELILQSRGITKIGKENEKMNGKKSFQEQ